MVRFVFPSSKLEFMPIYQFLSVIVMLGLLWIKLKFDNAIVMLLLIILQNSLKQTHQLSKIPAVYYASVSSMMNFI